MINQNPEQIARDKIDAMLTQAGWQVQSKNKVNLSAALGVAVREYQTDGLSTLIRTTFSRTELPCIQ